MDYKKIYATLIEKRRSVQPTGYCENHHIVPRSLGGTDEVKNLVLLTAREHFIAHMLLLKSQVRETPEYYKMLKAFLMISSCASKLQERVTPSKRYEKLREEYSNFQSEKMSGFGNTQFGTRWISDPVSGSSGKIPKSTLLPEGWVFGRNRVFQKCKNCGEKFIAAFPKSTCGKDCESFLKSKLKLDFWTTKVLDTQVNESRKPTISSM